MVAKVRSGEQREGNSSLRGAIQRKQRGEEEEEGIEGDRRGWKGLKEVAMGCKGLREAGRRLQTGKKKLEGCKELKETRRG